MDKNSITGIVLICAIMFAWMWYSAPSKDEIAKQRRAKDSLELAQKQKAQSQGSSRQLMVGKDSTSNVQHLTSNRLSDSSKQVERVNKFDVFASASKDSNRFFTIENELLKATISSKGGRICSVVLKKYRTYDSLPLTLFDADSSSFGLLFDTEHNRTINSSELYFQPILTEGKGEKGVQKFSMRLYATRDT